jgi:hypothetical protein
MKSAEKHNFLYFESSFFLISSPSRNHGKNNKKEEKKFTEAEAEKEDE